VLLVSFFPPQHTRNWARRHGLPFLIGSDETRDVYLRYGLDNAKAADLIGPHVWLAGLKAFASTREMPGYSRYGAQRGGYFVVDDGGTLRYSYPSRGPADHPPVGDLLKALGVDEDGGVE
jgi:peroxiredoxin